MMYICLKRLPYYKLVAKSANTRLNKISSSKIDEHWNKPRMCLGILTYWYAMRSAPKVHVTNHIDSTAILSCSLGRVAAFSVFGSAAVFCGNVSRNFSNVSM